MDPLSIAASSIAVLGAVTSTGKGIGKLVSLRDAPVELQALSNEAEAFRSLLVIVQSSIRHIQGSDAYEEFGEALCDLLSNAKRAALDLQSKIEYELKSGIEIDKNGLPKVSRTAWLGSSGEIEKLRQRINTARSDLSTGLQAIHHLHLSETIRQFTVQLQSISQVVSTSYAGGFNGLDGRKSGNVGHGQLDAPQPALIDDAASVCESSVETDLRRVTRTTCANTLPVKITTSVTTLRCPHRCPCQCHKRSHIRTSPWFKAIIGQMLFSYHSLIRTTPCDYQPCRETPDKTPRKTEFVYYFPHWLAWRALIVSSTSKTLGPGPSVLIDFPIVLPYGNPIFSAVRRGNIPFLQQLFGRGYNPHIVDKFGMSLALGAVICNQLRTYKFLVQQGAKPDWRDDRGISPKTALLLRYTLDQDPGLDFEDEVDNMGMSDLHAALIVPSRSPEPFPMLLQREFRSVNAKDMLGMTPLHWAARRGQLKAVELLINWNGDVRARDNDQMTPLHHACWSGDTMCTTLLLNAGADVNALDDVGESPIFYTDCCDVITLLVQRGANLELRDHRGYTALHQAAYHGYFNAIGPLVMHGADINATECSGRSPMDLAISRDDLQCVSALSRASERHGVPIKWKSTRRDNFNALHLIALHAGVEIMQLLANANLTGLDPTQRFGNVTPDDYFVHWRDEYCTIIREPFEEEEKAWHNLLRSACLQNDINFDALKISRVSELDEEDSTDAFATSEEGDEDDHRPFVDAPERIDERSD